MTTDALTLFRPLLLATVAFVAACGGGGDDDNGGGPVTSVTVSGKVTFDRVPFKSTPGQGLDFAAPVVSPARDVLVEAIEPGNVLGGERILASGLTDAAGDYSLQVPANRTVFVRAKAQMLKAGAAPTWSFRVLNNTNGDALYTLDSAQFNSGTAGAARNLHASSGWGTTSYTGPRSAAPFAILDTMYRVKALILTAKADTAFPDLDLFWSTQNRPSEFLCPDEGDIISSLHVVYAADETDECTDPTSGRSGIYILGNFAVGDTDEFDPHIIAHEAGHYFEMQFSRSDSIGGEHSPGDRLDLRVAFGEGWGNAFAAMVLNDPLYRDSDQGAGRDTFFNIESQILTRPGWFAEFSVHKFLWDVFDPANEANDTVALGFLPIYNVMTGPQRQSDALTSLFSFTRVLKAANPAAASGIDALLSAEHFVQPVTDDFGTSETAYNDNPNVVPIYTNIVSGTPRQLCGTNIYGLYNKLSNRRFLRFDSTSSRTIAITVTATGGGSADPDILIWRRGELVDFGVEVGNQEILQVPVVVGTYIIEIYDYNHVDPDASTGVTETCMTVSVAG